MKGRIVSMALVASFVVFGIPEIAHSAVTACYSFSRDSGELRLSTPARRCSRGENVVSWDKAGRKGDRGNKGPPGPPGWCEHCDSEGGAPSQASLVFDVGAVCFGIVAGWITYRTLRRKTRGPSVSDLAAVISAVGGGVVVGVFKVGDSFGWYAIGLATGFFSYLLLMARHEGWEKTVEWMGDEPAVRPGQQPVRGGRDIVRGEDEE